MDLLTRIAEIEERCKKATRGPWVEGLYPHDQGHVHFATKVTERDRERGSGPYIERGLLPVGIDIVCHMQISNSPNFREDAAFIANARDDIPFLIAELRKLLPAEPTNEDG